MKMYALLIALALTGNSWFCCTTAGAQKQANRNKPNVILIMTDDQGYGDLACLGNRWIDSPNIDRLHADSVRLTDFHVSPMCSPTRAALLTGRHCRHVGVRHTNNCTNLIAFDVPTMADVFAKNGYRTGMFGKWHLGEHYPYRPHDRGFHEAVYHGNGAIGTTGDVWGNDYFDDTYHHNGKPKKYSGYCTDVWFAEASRFIRESHGEGDPFFCYLAPNVVHGPMRVADEYFLRYRDVEGVFSRNAAIMYGMVANLDENIGRLVGLLKSESLDRDTILIFMTDNGTAAGTKLDKQGFVTAGYNAGMRGKKTSSYEGGHRVPFFLRWPGGEFVGGRDVPQLAAHLDVLPTLVDICGLERPSGLRTDGVSLKPLLKGNADKWPERTIVESFTKVAMTERWRLVHNTELYDINADPGQRRDVAQQHPEVVQKLQAALAENGNKEDTRQQEIFLGAEQARHVVLTPEHWLDESREYRTFRNGIILQGEPITGIIPVEVAAAGRYKFTLRRWPEQLETPIRAAAKVTVPSGISGGTKTGRGQSLPIVKAHLKVADFDSTVDVTDEMMEATFTVPLKQGGCDIQAQFIADDGKEYGAYFLSVERQQPVDDGFVDLFAGGNLKEHFETTGNWTLSKEGVAHLQPREGETDWKRYGAYLWLKKEYKDFECEFEYKHEKGGNSGFYFNVTDRQNAVGSVIEIQIKDSAGESKLSAHGICGGILPGITPKANAAKPAGEWNQIFVSSVSGVITVKLNGVLVNEAKLTLPRLKAKPKQGFIGIQDHGLPFSVRRFRIRQL